MSDKSYLKNQIKLVSLNANDMFTNEEYEKYMEIISYVNEIDRLDQSKDPADVLAKKDLIAQKKEASKQLSNMIAKHAGTPRKVRKESVIYRKDGEELPDGVNWWNLKLSKKIAEFESDMSRMMGLKTDEHTFDKIIVKWKNEDLLKQLVMDGFVMDVLEEDGRVIQKKYRCFTASAGQLRRDKSQFISEDMWLKIKDRIECGLNWDTINARGGMNVNKMLAYWALCGSATDPWPEFDIDRAIVLPRHHAVLHTDAGVLQQRLPAPQEGQRADARADVRGNRAFWYRHLCPWRRFGPCAGRASRKKLYVQRTLF